VRENYKALIPLYAAAFVILFCGISAVNSTVEDSTLTFVSTALVALGVFSSLWMRAQGADQKVVVWLASGMAAVLFIMQPSLHDLGRNYLASSDSQGLSSSGIGVVVEWATVLFSFTLLTNHSLLFAIVPSMALIGLMSSENLNPEMVTYFLGFILSTVFLMGYHAHLERTSGARQEEEGKPISIRPFVVLSTGVVMGAFLIGIIATAPLKFVGRQVFSVASSQAPSLSVPLLPVSLNNNDNLMDLKGRPPSLTNAEVMRIQSPAEMYWRGMILDRYTGQSWDTPFRGRTVDPVVLADADFGGLNTFQLSAKRDLTDRIKDLEQADLTVSTQSFSGTLYGTGIPFRVRGPMDHIQADAHLSLRSDWNPNQVTYHVTTLISHATPDELRSAPSIETAMNDPSSPLIYPGMAVNSGWGLSPMDQQMAEIALNTRLPYQPDDPHYLNLKRLAERLTAGLTNNYDRAAAIERYLKSNFIYTLEPPLLPSDADAAEYFLFTTRSGYCEQFANAMAVLLRTLQIPSHIAIGYAPGEYDPQHREWVVRDLDAHAWVEVFFPGYGWITFDPTGGIQPEPGGFFSFRKLFSRLIHLFDSRQFFPSLILLSVFAVFVYILKTEGYDRFLRRPILEWLRRRRSGEPNNPRWAVEKNYFQLRKSLRKIGVSPRQSQTPLEFQAEAREKLNGKAEVIQPLERLTALYMEAIYSAHPLPEESDKAATAWLRQAKEGLRNREGD
jgi:hypothetical protein